MRKLTNLFLVYACTTILMVCGPSSGLGQASDSEVTKRTLSLRLTDADFIHVVATLSVEHRIPIGVEAAADEAESPKLNIEVNDESLKNVLDLIAQQAPAYRWEVKDGVINFVPTQSRDPFLSQLLSTRVSRFAPGKVINKYGIRDAIMDLPEVRKLFGDNNMIGWRLGPPTQRSVYSNDDTDLTISDTNVRGVLNKVARDSEHKLWVVSRHSHRKDIIQINF